MNQYQIRQFLVLSKTMNMTKAARELYITQPALSRSLSKLEDELGLKLMYRDGNRLIMTDAGRKILADFETIQKGYDEMYRHIQTMQHKYPQKITLGFAGSITAFSSLFTYGLLSDFHGADIQKVFADYEVIDNMLQNGQIDFAITFPPIKKPNVESRILMHDPIRLAVAGGHMLLRQPVIQLEDLKNYTLLSLTSDNLFVSYCEELLSQKNTVLTFDRKGYSELVAEVNKGRNMGKILSITTKQQFSSWFGRGYRSMNIDDFKETLDTAISWRSDSDFGYEYKELIAKIEAGYDRIYFRNYRNMKPEQH